MAFEYLPVAICALIGLCLTLGALLKGWEGWLDLKRREMERGETEQDTSPTGARIELAAMRERIRRLEAIAAGVDL
ncbi:hypothetical protein [Croceicoccus hydrothermalis]|uniref:hypothetical protein n=1 Tax=Croceicoccus hydrothermalis TaxID=2867964 RepID=UPI001EFA7789|nr:hypothetical protein [Croceicoccus hydrothermalis]